MVLGLLPALAGWQLLRRIARARAPGPLLLMLDLSPVLIGWSVLFAVTGRPICAGLVILALAGGLGIADRTKRQVLREPVVFSDMSELVQVFTNPELYLPFAPRGLLYGGGAVLVLAALAMLPLERPVWHGGPLPGLLATALLLAFIALVCHEPVLSWSAAWLRRFSPLLDPEQDAARFGPLFYLPLYGMIARAERPTRRDAARPPALPALPAPRGERLPPIVLIQSESFFDARRLDAGIAPEILTEFDRLAARGGFHGRFGVPCWGANTIRTECSVLTGLTNADLGFDRFNPYHAFARVPIRSLAWQLRAAGYRTICIHPYSRNFYRRNEVIFNLGFEQFISIESFAGAERTPNGWISDRALALRMVELIDAAPNGLFLFAMTMENHGPWLADPAGGFGVETAPGLPISAEYVPLRRYLAGIRNADAMLTMLSEHLFRHDPEALLAMYGDHLPSLPISFRMLPPTETATDYLVSRAGLPAIRRDLSADRLAELILETARVRVPA
jgi:hypothetical protein